MKAIFSFLSLFVLLLSGCASVQYAGTAEFVRLNRVFGDHMVLQRNIPIRIFGTASPGGSVAVRFDNAEPIGATANAEGEWSCTLPPRPAGGPYTLEVYGEKSVLKVRDILVGDIWFCSGQSNMRMGVLSSLNGNKEVAEAKNTRIRLLQLPKIAARTPLAEPVLADSWAVCSPESVRLFSAAGYFFGRELERELQIPIGLIDASWGGTPVEFWMPAPKPAGADVVEKDRVMAETALKTLFARRVAIRECYAFEANTAEQIRRAAIDYDDSAWKTMKLPGIWEKQGMPGFDGIVQYRLTLDLPASWAGRELELELGAIDETDITYFNGVQIDSRGSLVKDETGYWNRPRYYRVPAKLVRGGKNVIAIFIGDLHGEGGFWGKAPMQVNPVGLPDDAISLECVWKYEPIVSVPTEPESHGSGYNSMVAPFFRFPIAGVIWYQGEANANNPPAYLKKFPAMIRDWRTNWDRNLPFYFVQLANYTARKSVDSWANLRDAQRRTLELEPNTGMAIAIDIGDPKDIHPKNKQEVGRRLALLALKNTYGRGVVEQGPLFDRAEFGGGKVLIRFKPSSSPLVVHGAALAGFEVAGADGKFHAAEAKIVGKDTVLAHSPQVAAPQQVRYLWADNPVATLYNEADLPASSFTSGEIK